MGTNTETRAFWGQMTEAAQTQTYEMQFYAANKEAAQTVLERFNEIQKNHGLLKEEQVSLKDLGKDAYELELNNITPEQKKRAMLRDELLLKEEFRKLDKAEKITQVNILLDKKYEIPSELLKVSTPEEVAKPVKPVELKEGTSPEGTYADRERAFWSMVNEATKQGGYGLQFTGDSFEAGGALERFKSINKQFDILREEQISLNRIDDKQFEFVLKDISNTQAYQADYLYQLKGKEEFRVNDQGKLEPEQVEKIKEIIKGKPELHNTYESPYSMPIADLRERKNGHENGVDGEGGDSKNGKPTLQIKATSPVIELDGEKSKEASV